MSLIVRPGGAAMDGARREMPFLRTRLFVMMLLEFFIWGAWLPMIFGYLPALGFNSLQQSLILNAFPAAAILGMFFSNQFADRNFAGEKFVAFSHLVGGVAMLSLGFVKSFTPFFTLMLIHCLFYVPTISITNSIAFANLKDAQKEFGIVRMGGTIGWILAAWPFYFIFKGLEGQAAVEATRWTYIVAGIASLALAAFSLSLPHTPPRRPEGSEGKLAWLEAMKLLKQPFVLVLWIVTLIDSFVHMSYFNWTERFLLHVGIPKSWTMPVMSISQISEILTMAVLGVVLKKLGWRATMIVGILGHAARFAVYAFLPDKGLVVAVQVLHGICYAFFFATVYIFVDAFFPKDARSSAQGLFNVMILGLGPLIANFLCPYLFDHVFTKDGVTDWRSTFLLPMISAAAAAVALAVFFRPPRTQEAGASVPEAQPSGA
jgi:nucleoside transporter